MNKIEKKIIFKVAKIEDMNNHQHHIIIIMVIIVVIITTVVSDHPLMKGLITAQIIIIIIINIVIIITILITIITTAAITKPQTKILRKMLMATVAINNHMTNIMKVAIIMTNYRIDTIIVAKIIIRQIAL